MSRAWLIVPVLALLAACDTATGPSPAEALRLVLPSTELALDPDSGWVDVPYRVENPSDQDLYVTGCDTVPAPWVDEYDGSRWITYSGPVCPTPDRVTDVLVRAGAQVDGTVRILVAGRYRLGITVRTDPGGSEAWLHVSEPFDVR